MKPTFLLLSFSLFFVFCKTHSYTTVATPMPSSKMLVTSGDLPHREYSVLGFIESTSTVERTGVATENKISSLKTLALNNGLVRRAESMGADAVINVQISTNTRVRHLFFIETTVFVTGTAVRFK